MEPGDELPILKKTASTESDLPILKKKADTGTSSVQSTAPSNQALENAQTTTVPGLNPTNQESIPSQLPLENGTSVSGASTSASPQPQKVSQAVLNSVIDKHLSSPVFQSHPDAVAPFLANMEKNGYSPDMISKAKEYSDILNKQRNDEREWRKKRDEVIARNKNYIEDETGMHETLLQSMGLDKLGFGGKYDPLVPLVNWANDFAAKTVTSIGQGGDKINEGLQTMLNATGDLSSNESHIETLGHGALQTLTGGAQAAFNTIPAAITFNAGVDAINTTAKKNLSPENAKVIEDATSIPFTIASRTANALGIDPKEGSNSAMLLELLNFAVAGKALHSVTTGEIPLSNKIQSLEDLKEMSKKASENKLSPKEESEFKAYTENLSKVNLQDIKSQAEKSDTPAAKEIVSKIDQTISNSKTGAIKEYLQVPNSEIAKISSEGETSQSLRDKAVEIQNKLSEPPAIQYTQTSDQAGNKYYFAVDTKTNEQVPVTEEEFNKQTQLQLQDKQQLADTYDHVVAMSNAIDTHETVVKDPKKAIDEVNSDQSLSQEEKEAAVQKITNAAELDKSQKTIEDAKIQHIRDIHAVANPGSAEFYHLAESALSDENVIPRIKTSLEAAATAGEISPEEAQAQLDALKERIPIQEALNPAFKNHPDIAMKAVELATDLKAKEEDLKKVKSYIGSEPEITIQNKERAVENRKEKIAQLLDQAKEITKTEKPPVEPPIKDNSSDFETPEEKTRAIWKRVIGNMKDEELKQGIEKEGVSYLVKKQDITESSAKSVLDSAIEAGDLQSLEKVVVDDANKMDTTTRGALSAMLGKHYFDLSEKEIDPKIKQDHLDEFYKYTDKAAALATEGGQIGNAIGKIIKKMYANNPETIIAKIKKGMDDANSKVIDKKGGTETYEAIKKILASEEGQAAITEEISKKSERLFGKETQKKITDLFDKAKIDTKGKVFDASIGLPVAVYNGAVEAMKQAALLGAKGADIIAEGIKHIRDNHKEEWDDKIFKDQWEKDLKDSGVKFGKKRSLSEKQEASILDSIEKKAGRLNPENREKFLKNIVHTVESEGGLDQQKFKDLYAEALGLPSMTNELVEKIKGYSKIINEGEASEKAYMKALDDVVEAEKNGSPKEEVDKLKSIKSDALDKSMKASLDAKKANDELSTLMKGDKKLVDTWIGMMQLGALTPASLIKNITAMPAELVFRILATPMVGAADYIMTGLANVGVLPESFKERKVDSIARSKGALSATSKAFKKLFNTVIHGSFTDDYTSREIANKITPVDAAKNIKDMITGKTPAELSSIGANIIEASPMGYMASAMGRALAGPDALFRTYGEQSKAYELGTMEGLKGAELEKFMADPPPEALEKIVKAGDEITFQQDNMITEMISGATSSAKRFIEKNRKGELGKMDRALLGAARVLAKSQALYIKTPTNVLGSVLRMISPELSAIQAAKEMIKGSKADKEYISKKIADVAVGYALRYFITTAIKKGMVTPTVDYKSKEGSAQSDMNIKHGGKFNKSAYYRMLTGGDWKEQKDDVWIDYSKWTGGLGIAMGAYAQMLDGMPPEEINQMTAVKNSYKVLPTVLQQVMDLSFMSTTAQLIDAVRDGKGVQKWVTSTAGTLATPLIPNTFSTTIKATSDTKRETRDESIMQNIINDFDYKLTGGKDLPSKVSLWGEKVSTAPEGSNKYAYYLFDVAKAENPDENSVGYKVMDLYHKTNDERVIPAAPSNQITISGKKVTLDPHQFEQFEIYVGGLRKKLASEYINSDSYESDSDNEKAYKLQRIYSSSHKQAVDMITNSDDHLTDIKNDNSENSPVTGNKISSRRVKSQAKRKGRKNNR